MPTKKKLSKRQKTRVRPEQFQTFAECVRWNKKSVYLIARGRKIVDKTEWTTLGSGFLAKPNKLVTASHVINDPTKKDPKMLHKEGDAYYLLRKDDENNIHLHVYPYALNKSIFIYPAEDIAIFHLEDSFYKLKGQVFARKEEYIPISKGFCAIGTEIGILGYPISALRFENGDFNRPIIGNILLRTDQGVVNCRYQAERVFAYQFTLSFNPGNSGGPIFDSKTGRVVSIVKGFNTILLMDKNKEIAGQGENPPVIPGHAHATYSVGFATPTFLDIFKKHGIL